MAFKFSDPTQFEHTKTGINFYYEHLIAVPKLENEPGYLSDPMYAAIDPNTNNIYITDLGCVTIYSESGEFIDSFSHPSMRKPSGITIHKDNIYITDRGIDSLFHFKIAADIHFVTRVGRNGYGFGEFRDPRQLTVSTTNGDIFVTDTQNHRIQILDSHLHFKREISHDSISYPCDVKLTLNEVYILVDDSDLCVRVFSYAGEWIRSLITIGTGRQNPIPFSLCLDNNENLYISDLEACNIKIFSKTGDLLHILGGPGHEVGELEYPV